MENVVLSVKGMSCAHCKKAVEQALQKAAGVSGAEADVAAGTVSVTFDPGQVSLETIKEIIVETGYQVL